MEFGEYRNEPVCAINTMADQIVNSHAFLGGRLSVSGLACLGFVQKLTTVDFAYFGRALPVTREITTGSSMSISSFMRLENSLSLLSSLAVGGSTSVQNCASFHNIFFGWHELAFAGHLYLLPLSRASEAAHRLQV